MARPRDATVDRAIREATLDLLARRGLAGVTIQAVATRAGVPRSTVYRRHDDVTALVEDAVDTMNENAPAPELSSHRFDVTAEETGDGGAVVTLAFEPDTIEIEGSTKRLLQYQLQSFADRESTPAADVTIGRDRIVIEIADSEGTAIQRWGEAAVRIVDRTLYLSDNSPDS